MLNILLGKLTFEIDRSKLGKIGIISEILNQLILFLHPFNKISRFPYVINYVCTLS